MTFFALLGLMVGECAKKFAQRTKNGPKSAVCCVLGELFRENTVVGAALGEFTCGAVVVGAPRRLDAPDVTDVPGLSPGDLPGPGAWHE